MFPIWSSPGAVKPAVPIGAVLKNVSELLFSDGTPFMRVWSELVLPFG
jgi:hypothetical protein